MLGRSSKDEVLDDAAAILATAFLRDPMFVIANANPARRLSGLPLCWRALGRQVRRRGGWIDLAERDGRPVGAAMWLPGDSPEITLADALRDGQLSFGLVGGIPQAWTLMKMQEVATAKHLEIATEPHHYLLGLGVLPTMQGQGVGSELLDRGLARCDADGVGAYLETNLAMNVRLYERKGFVVQDDQDNYGYHTWFMKREVREG